MPDRDEENEEREDGEATYPDGSAQNECWAETGYTRKKPPALKDEDLSVLRGD